MDKFTASIDIPGGCAFVEVDSLNALCAALDLLTGTQRQLTLPGFLPNAILEVEANDACVPSAAASGALFGDTVSAAPFIPATSSVAVVPLPTAPEAPTSPALPVPPAPAPAPAPEAAAQSAPAIPAAPVRDANGLPWDHRIHAATKTMNADGTWRQKRGLDEAVAASVKAELASVVAVSAPASAEPTVSYATLMEELTKPLLAGKLALTDVAAACLEHGVANLPALIHRPDLVGAVRASVMAKVRE